MLARASMGLFFGLVILAIVGLVLYFSGVLVVEKEHTITRDVYKGQFITDRGLVLDVEIHNSVTTVTETKRYVRVVEHVSAGATVSVAIEGWHESYLTDWTKVSYASPTSGGREDGGGFTAKRVQSGQEQRFNNWDWKAEANTLQHTLIPDLEKKPTENGLLTYNEEIGYTVSLLDKAMSKCFNRDCLVESSRWSDDKQQLVSTYKRDPKP